MKKVTLSLLSLTAVLSLAACSQASRVSATDDDSEAPAVEKVKVAPTSLKMDRSSMSLRVGDTLKNFAHIAPVFAYDADLLYESSDEEIATVDQDGLVTAVAPGKVTVTVSSILDPTVKTSFPVYVTAQENDQTTFRAAITAMKNYQNEHAPSPQKLKSVMSYNYYLDIDGKRKESTWFERDITISKPDGYFSMDTYSESVNTYDGGVQYDYYGYKFLTKKNYSSFMFHDGDSVKNVLYLVTESFADDGIDRYEVVNKILDSLFTAGRDIGDNCIKYALNTKYLTRFEIGSSGGVAGSDLLAGEKIEDTTYNVGNDQESSFEIPAGTEFKAYDVDAFLWEKGYCKRYGILYDWTYTLDGKVHHNVTDIVYTFYIDDEFEYTLPEVKDYHSVASLSDW